MTGGDSQNGNVSVWLKAGLTLGVVVANLLGGYMFSEITSLGKTVHALDKTAITLGDAVELINAHTDKPHTGMMARQEIMEAISQAMQSVLRPQKVRDDALNSRLDRINVRLDKIEAALLRRDGNGK